LGSSLAAQTPEQRRTIDALRDTLQSITDSTLLRAREERLLAAAQKSRNDALLHLRLGQLALRQGELGGASHFDDAASEFVWATELAPQWAYAWYGLGLAEYALGNRLTNTPEPHSPAREAWSRAMSALARAAVLEPGLASRLEALTDRALRDRAPERAAILREAVRRATLELHGARGARLLLALGRIQRATGDSGALSSFEGYLATGDDRPLALLELGRTELLAGDLRGMTAYLAGAAEEDPLAVAEYRADLLPIANQAELADFELRRGSARAETLRHFWQVRDRLELRQEGERLAEQLRRMQVARREFTVVGEDGSERLDDRGRIYVRHGEPDDRASFTIPGVQPNESWRYHRGGTDVVLHFVARQSPNDFRMVESVLDVADLPIELSAPDAAGSSTRITGNTEQQLLRSRSALAPVYGQVGSVPRGQVAAYLDQERALGRRGIQVETSSDSDPLRFERDLDAWGSLLVAGGSGAQPAIQVVFAIPGYAVEPASGAAGIVYPVRLRFIALDAEGNVVAAVDSTTRIELNAPVAPNRSLLGRVSIPVRPGRLVARAAVQYGDHAGTTFEVDTLTVPASGGGELALGDLVVGAPGGRFSVPLGERGAVPLSPGGAVHRSDGAVVGVEVFGLQPGDRASIRLLAAPLDSLHSGAPLRWRAFPDGAAVATLTRSPGAGPIVAWHAVLPLKKLKPGSWLLAVEVSDPAGRTARREGRLLIQAP
jgi:GWxTD domain-containing protein